MNAKADPQVCGALLVFDLDLLTETDCELPAGHTGPHSDGTAWWTDDGETVAPPPGPKEQR